MPPSLSTNRVGPACLVVMGVSACGKSEVGRQVAEQLGGVFIDGDPIDDLGSGLGPPAAAVLAAGELHLAEESLAGLPTPPAVASDAESRSPARFSGAEVVERIEVEDKVEVVLAALVEGEDVTLPTPLRQGDHACGQVNHADAAARQRPSAEQATATGEA